MTFTEWAHAYYGADPSYFPESKDAFDAWTAATEAAIPEGYVVVPAGQNTLYKEIVNEAIMYVERTGDNITWLKDAIELNK